MNVRIGSVILAVLFALSLSGCATPQSLTVDQAAAIRTIALDTDVTDKEWTVLDHTNVWQKSYTYGMFGLLGGLVEAGILAAEQKTKENESLGGDVKTLRKEVASLDVKHMMDEELKRRLQGLRQVVSPAVPSQAGADGQEVASPAADAVLKLQLKYGLAVYADNPANAAIDAALEVTDGRTGDVLMKTKLQSDWYHRDHHVVDDFAANEGRLFKEGIAKAIESLGKQVAAELLLTSLEPRAE